MTLALNASPLRRAADAKRSEQFASLEGAGVVERIIVPGLP